MADQTKNAISVTVRYRAYRDRDIEEEQNGPKFGIQRVSNKNSKFYEQIQNGRLDPKCYLGYDKRQSETDQNLGSQG